MKTKNLILIAVVSITLLSACNRKLFTQSVKNNLFEIDTLAPLKVQYYLDRKLVIQYTSKNKEEFITQGKVTTDRDNYIYTYVFPKGTKCVAQNVLRRGQQMKFSTNANAWILFTENNGEYVMATIGNTCTFEGKRFVIIEGAGVKLRYAHTYKKSIGKKKTRVKGVKVN